MAHIRVYAVVHSGAAGTPSDEQWGALFGAAKTYPLAAALLAAARSAQNYLTHDKRSQNPDTDYYYKYTMVGFEVDEQDRTALLAVLDTQAAARSITGTNMEKFADVLQGELQDAALGLGYPANAAEKLTYSVIGYGDRAEAIAEAQNYLANNPDIWYEN